MKDKMQVKKILILILAFVILSIGISYITNIKINALQNEKNKLIEDVEYQGDCSDSNMNFDDDIVIKIINKMDSSIDIKYINKFDKVDDNNNEFLSIELSLSGDIDKIKEVENILKDLKLNYEIENIKIQTPKNSLGKEKNYVDCIMTFKVI